ncbi:hypothetical protein O3P69_004046 [Scylla paramamosain]|uniref:Uncharacterized protein n=1 Tax=Scylla paramamosain TaxID=85552 RepID=A0AAW0UHG4_SCYPA
MASGSPARSMTAKRRTTCSVSCIPAGAWSGRAAGWLRLPLLRHHLAALIAALPLRDLIPSQPPLVPRVSTEMLARFDSPCGVMLVRSCVELVE